MTRVAVLTPPGTGAIATVEVSGPRAWEFARQLFRPSRKPLPEMPEANRFWFGMLGGDEVILAVAGATPQAACLEVHCHGGRRVVRWVIEQFVNLGCVEREENPKGSLPNLLTQAPTLRTAAILLDQLHGAFDNAMSRILASPTLDGLAELARFAPVGRHLVEPWKVVVAGPPNVGKSSLVNALAGYQRTVVSAVPGTTRDAVSVQLAFDGWPFELTDTAGLRDAEGLEAAGIERANRALADADLVLWVTDSPVAHAPGSPGLLVRNKSDLAHEPPPGLAVSAKTGAGIPELVAEITRRLVPFPPPPGAAVPYTPQLAEAVTRTHLALSHASPDEAVRLLREALTRPG